MKAAVRNRPDLRGGAAFFVGFALCMAFPMASANSADQPALESMMTQGKEVYDKTCVICHQPTGMGLSGTFPPLVAGTPFEADPSVIEPLEQRGFHEDGKMVLGKAEDQVNVVLNGIPGTRMFGFGHVLSDEEVAAVVTYIRNAWGNSSGDVVTPDQVTKSRR